MPATASATATAVTPKARAHSDLTYQRMCQIIPGGVNSPVRACVAMKQTPLVVDYAKGDMVYDVDGHRYIDYCGSWGALIHGHAHPYILEKVAQRMAKGTTYGITSAIEEQLAQKVVSIMPSIEKIRFVSSGTEATMSAVRLARGFTKRDIIVKFIGNYHGHADHFLVQAGSGVFGLSQNSSSAGIPKEMVKHTLCLPYNDVKVVREFLNHPQYCKNIAAVIIEPIAGNIGTVPATQEFINMLREETKKIGALLIFDEVITGFRVHLKGAQELYKVTPELTCLGKIVGGGFPAAAFGGRADIMNYLAPIGPVYQAGTLSGNPLAMEAGLQTLKLCEAPGFYKELERKTNLLTQPLKEFLAKKKKNACIQQVGSMFTLFFGKEKVSNADDLRQLDSETFAKFFRYMFAKGIYIPPLQPEAWFVSTAHEEKHLLTTRDIILNFFN